MENYLSVIESSELFSRIAENDITSIEGCLSPAVSDYKKNQYVLHVGDSLTSIGLVLSGCVHVVQEDFWGNRNIMAKVTPGDIFGESYACVRDSALAVSVVTTESTKILFLDAYRVMHRCASSCEFHARLIRNLLAVVAKKNLMLNAKLMHVTQRTTRQKLLSYLSAEAAKSHRPLFEIPFNRQQLADYLSVDRSAMSNELCKLRDEGILRFERNKFKLIS
ncbi:MAG: Crp/Fnr family transcriptional regulator [Synergistaceae bacterium]|nr:Crp/Fnr family transcriptional regulator [Synergistaceae bacterium]